MKKILDACCGSRMFWFNKDHPITMLTDFRGLYGEGPNLYLTVGDAALRNFLEAPGRLPELRKVLNKFFGPDKVLIYRTPRS